MQASTRRDPHHTPVKWDYQSLCAGREGVGVRQAGGVRVRMMRGVSEWGCVKEVRQGTRGGTMKERYKRRKRKRKSIRQERYVIGKPLTSGN